MLVPLINRESESGGGSGTGGNVPAGGSMGQVLTKRSATDYDVMWDTPSSGTGNDYRTYEQKIGTWIDGKVLYRKVITGNTIPANGTTLVSNVTDLVACGGEQLYTDSSNSIWFHFPYVAPNDIVLRPELYESSNSIKLNSSGSTLSKISKYKWWFEYTKTVIDGKTATPTDDVQILLECAELDYLPYTTMLELLADTNAFTSVISSGNAVDYLVRSTMWINTICSDSTAMTIIGSSNNASNILLLDENWTLGIANSAYYSEVLNAEIPVMTSNNEPSGTASSDTNYSTNYAYKAMDGDETTNWSTPGQQGSFPHWLRYDFETSMVAHCFSLLVGSSASTKACKIQAYDGSSWVDLLSFTEPSDNYSNLTTRFINNSTSYNIYRLYISSSYTGKVSSARTFQLYGRRDV